MSKKFFSFVTMVRATVRHKPNVCLMHFEITPSMQSCPKMPSPSLTQEGSLADTMGKSGRKGSRALAARFSLLVTPPRKDKDGRIWTSYRQQVILQNYCRRKGGAYVARKNPETSTHLLKLQHNLEETR